MCCNSSSFNAMTQLSCMFQKKTYIFSSQDKSPDPRRFTSPSTAHHPTCYSKLLLELVPCQYYEKMTKVPLAIIFSHVSHSPTECSCSSKSDAAKLLSAVALLFSSTLPIKSRHGCPCRALHFSHYYRSLLGSHVHQF